MVVKKMSYEKLVEECKRLRLKSERAEAEFFIFLLLAEQEQKEIWQGGGCDTFEQFLASNHLCRPDRYRFFAIGVERTSAETALANGAHWTIQAGRMPVPSKKALTDFSDRAAAFIEIENTAPSEEAVRQWAAEVNANGRQPGKIVQVGELHRLRAENQELRLKLRVAEQRIAVLEGGQAKGRKVHKEEAGAST
jgi:hypothetical protein